MSEGRRDAPRVHLHRFLRGWRGWRSDVRRVEGRPRAGDLVEVWDGRGEFAGWAFWQPRAALALRMVALEGAPPDAATWRARAEAALARRRLDPSVPTDPVRVLHAEGDDFPGLVVDRYGPVLVAVAYTAPMLEVFRIVQPVLAEALDAPHWAIALDRTAADAEGSPPFEKRSAGCPPRVVFEEHGLRWEIFPGDGHKTGFFLDQRENRGRFAEWIAHARAEGRRTRVLDVCSYVGGFSLQAARVGAEEVVGVDLDERAVAQAKRHAAMNQLGKAARFVHADAFSWLRQAAANGARYDFVVVDPPKFVPSRREMEKGRGRYHDLNKLALQVLEPGGVLVTCSCSGLLTPIEFQELLRRAARPRGLRILRETGAGPDHPVRADFPEGRYLKCLWCAAD